MKVLLVGNYEPDQQRSMLGFASALLSGLGERGHDIRLIAPAQVVGRIGRPNAGVGKWLGYVDKFGLFPGQLRRALAWADVVHVCDQGNGIYMNYLQGVPHVLTCNDLLAIRSARGELPGWETGRTGRLYQRLILQGVNKAKRVACISETTRQDLLRIGQVQASAVSVVYEGLLHPYSPLPPNESATVLRPLGLDCAAPFLLHVGGNQPYKNRLAVLKIFIALRQKPEFQEKNLVMAGKPFTAPMRQFVAEQGLEDRVRELTGLTNEQLRALYSQAEALIFPSLYEGFGLPIIEAQACGCPVFTSDRAPMTEVGGDAAVYLNPTQPEQAAQVIVDNLGRAEQMKAAGMENVKRFSTERMLDEYIQIYRQVAGAA